MQYEARWAVDAVKRKTLAPVMNEFPGCPPNYLVTIPTELS
jgi:hypothetical protein